MFINFHCIQNKWWWGSTAEQWSAPQGRGKGGRRLQGPGISHRRAALRPEPAQENPALRRKEQKKGGMRGPGHWMNVPWSQRGRVGGMGFFWDREDALAKMSLYCRRPHPSSPWQWAPPTFNFGRGSQSFQPKKKKGVKANRGDFFWTIILWRKISR